MRPAGGGGGGGLPAGASGPTLSAWRGGAGWHAAVAAVHRCQRSGCPQPPSRARLHTSMLPRPLEAGGASRWPSVSAPCPAAILQVDGDGEGATFQLLVALNCTHEAPFPHSDVASFAANVTLAPEGDAVVRCPRWLGGSSSRPCSHKACLRERACACTGQPVCPIPGLRWHCRACRLSLMSPSSWTQATPPWCAAAWPGLLPA